MAIVSGPPWALSEDDMVNLLADFHCWLTNPWAANRLTVSSLAAASAFLGEGRWHQMAIASTDGEGYCDLCGLRIAAGVVRQIEAWTGNSLIFCLPCYQHQAAIVRRMGVIAYRKRWREQLEGDAGNGWQRRS